jgi:hypothetical protein
MSIPFTEELAASTEDTDKADMRIVQAAAEEVRGRTLVGGGKGPLFFEETDVSVTQYLGTH